MFAAELPRQFPGRFCSCRWCWRKAGPRVVTRDRRVRAINETVEVVIGAEVSGTGNLAGEVARDRCVSRIDRRVAIAVADEQPHGHRQTRGKATIAVTYIT